jgi:hypothetical protein
MMGHTFRDEAVLKHEFAGIGATHAELVQLLVGGKALEALLNDERGDPFTALCWLRLGIDNKCVGSRPIRNPSSGSTYVHPCTGVAYQNLFPLST